MSGSFRINNRKGNFDPLFSNNFKPISNFRGNISNNNKGFRGRAHFSHGYNDNFNSGMNAYDQFSSNHPSDFDFYYHPMNAQILNAAHVYSNQNAQRYQPSTSAFKSPVHVSASVSGNAASTASFNIPLVFTSVARGGFPIKGMSAPMISMSTATNSRQSAPDPVQTISTSPVNHASELSEMIAVDNQKKNDELTK